MASNQKPSLGDSSAPAIPFSYAQAAKGIASSHASAQSSRVASGAITPVTPVKDNSVMPTLKSDLAPGASWADDVESSTKEKEKESHSSATTVVDPQQSPKSTSPVIHAAHSQLTGNVSPPSPDFGSASTSTLAREDDAVSVPVTDTAWESKSQGSNIPEKRQISSDRAPSKGRGKGRGKKFDKSEESESWSQPALPLHEAPVPTRNPWNIQPVLPKPVLTRSSTAPLESNSASSKQAPVPGTTNMDAAKSERNKAVSIDSTRTTLDSRKEGESRSNQRREPRAGTKIAEKGTVDSQATKMTSPPMDQESWPTPDTVAERVHDKTEKSQNSQVEAAPVPAPKGKNAWAKVDFIPTVVFSTPLPSTSRRGGRGGSRGGRESNGRQPGAPSDKAAATSQPTTTSGESASRGRPDNSPRSSSPSKGKRAPSTETPAKREAPSRTLKERPADANVPTESRPHKAEESLKTNGASQDQRNGTSSRPKTTRRIDGPITNGEKPKEGEAGGKENESVVASRRASISNAPTGTLHQKRGRAKVTNKSAENGDRKYSPPIDPVTGSRYPSERKSGNYGSFSSRDRPEGGHRGGRGGSRGGSRGNGAHYGQSGYTNGQIQGNPGYSPRSPTGYQQDPFFGHQPTHSRTFRGVNRTHSIPDPYRSYPGYGTNGLPQLNTFVGQAGMYDYSNTTPMSAAPYSQLPYVDQTALIHSVARQL